LNGDEENDEKEDYKTPHQVAMRSFLKTPPLMHQDPPVYLGFPQDTSPSLLFPDF
jgi:hypothetical protein